MPGLDILYVEDDAASAQAVTSLFEGQGDRLVWLAGGLEGLARAGAQRFDVIILDRNLPDLDGLEIAARLRAIGSATPLLMLSALGRTENRVEGLDAGVDDYLAKPFDGAELIARVRALHRRSSAAAHLPVIVLGELECHVKSRTAHRLGRHIPLSPKEFTLFHYLMENAGELVTREMLLRDVWKLAFDPQTNVVDVNVGRLRRKLEDGFATPVLETIWGSGYRLASR